MQIVPVTFTYSTQGREKGGGTGPQGLVNRGLLERLEEQGHQVLTPVDVKLTDEEANQYGGWNLATTAGGRLAETVADVRRRWPDAFILGLLADCNAVVGVLGGLQAPVDNDWPQRVGLVFVDAHGDYNTPDTSPSGMLGGMPVAVAAGRALEGHRRRHGLRYPLQSPDIVMAGLRDLDATEARAIQEDGITWVSEDDMLDPDEAARHIMPQLVARQDSVYVHVDLDILDPDLAPAAGLPAPGGLSGAQLGAFLRAVVAYPTVRALAVVSYRAHDDRDGLTGEEVETAILTALEDAP